MKTMNKKELEQLIKHVSTGDLESAKELANTKHLPELAEDQAIALEGISQVSDYTFEDFYDNPFTREWELGAVTCPSGYAYGTENFKMERETLEAAQSIGAHLDNFLAATHFGLEHGAVSQAEHALHLMQLAQPLLEVFLKDAKEWEQKEFCLEDNKKAVDSKLAERVVRVNRYTELTELELMLAMMDETDELTKAELKAEAARRITAKKTPTLTVPTNTIRGDLDAMSKYYSGDLGGQRHSADAASVHEPKPFSNRDMIVPIISEMEG
ncbi:hypothetical protein [Vibrio sp. DNB22_12_1]